MKYLEEDLCFAAEYTLAAEEADGRDEGDGDDQNYDEKLTGMAPTFHNWPVAVFCVFHHQSKVEDTN